MSITSAVIKTTASITSLVVFTYFGLLAGIAFKFITDESFVSGFQALVHGLIVFNLWASGIAFSVLCLFGFVLLQFWIWSSREWEEAEEDKYGFTAVILSFISTVCLICAAVFELSSEVMLYVL